MTERRHRGRPRATRLQVIGVLGASLAGAGLILLVPALFQPGTRVQPWLLAVLALLVVVFAAVARHGRRAAPPGGEG